ncbi:maleylpyruvate isomerase family mycothiol-dependent enzyme [Cryptosporangium minutisporangium]|uniref:Maleylpyruvate isomerase family mycothiol-dependent enzyme n=1 Tax=Cryptosporangium minutisporangium TaxID=113569 RepID=A0ABP6T1B6_9ACTN
MNPILLDPTEIWPTIDAERIHLADLLDDLSPDEWREPSLCAGWTVKDVAAHLTLQEVGFGAALAMLVRNGGNVDRGIRRGACDRAREWSERQIVATVRAMVGSRRRNAGVTHRETLIDLLVHTQDITVPLGRRHEPPPRAAATAAARLWTMRWPPPSPATRALRGLRLAATDLGWSIGDGPLVEGPVTALMLLTAGRPAALPRVTGPGAAEADARLSRLGTAPAKES